MRVYLAALALAVAAVLAGCQSQRTSSQAAQSSGKSAALRNMEQVAIAAYRCWFDSRDAAFRDYSFANELNSFSGKPRFLLVPKNNFGGKPLLVVQAEGAGGQITTFGPLMDQPQGARINSDVRRWASGNSDCTGNA